MSNPEVLLTNHCAAALILEPEHFVLTLLVCLFVSARPKLLRTAVTLLLLATISRLPFATTRPPLLSMPPTTSTTVTELLRIPTATCLTRPLMMPRRPLSCSQSGQKYVPFFSMLAQHRTRVPRRRHDAYTRTFHPYACTQLYLHCCHHRAIRVLEQHMLAMETLTKHDKPIPLVSNTVPLMLG
jgi:hypothetical protein